MASLPPIWSGPGPEVTLSYVELQATDGRANLGLREPTAAERTLGAAVESHGSPPPRPSPNCATDSAPRQQPASRKPRNTGKA